MSSNVRNTEMAYNFFVLHSQKLYRFINTVDLVSPHHSIKEIVANLREGQIASLFQKSVKKVCMVFYNTVILVFDS